ncbi:discoidin domain-containing protein [Paenibacillus guangzhouensis]|uniref:discoidin domain-containing protein n=1 Tax=Paenibacillus guangzhouensis TaxID=1473112 RepID=UPI001D10B0E9|nr:discoidin domain-containing protein [Paenibacillus guangzhouensis]
MMSRVFALSLSVLIFISGIPAVMAAPASATAAAGIGQKAEAEDAVLSGGAKKGSSQSGYSGTGYVEGLASAGAAVKFTASVSATLNYEVTLRYANRSTSDSTLGVYINGVKRGTATFPGSASGAWADKKEMFVLDAGDNTIEYRFDAGDQGTVYIDYMIVNHYNPNPDPDQQNLIVNPGFEQGDFTGWRGAGDRMIVNSNAHTGNYAGRMGAPGASINQDLTNLKPNTTYTLKAWANPVQATDKDKLYLAAIKFDGPSAKKEVTTTTMGYQQLSVTFKTGSSNTTAEIYVWKDTTAGVFYVDDFELREGEGTDPNPDPELPPYTAPAPNTNLAYQHTAYVSSAASGNSGEKALDQTIASKWQSDPADPQWLIADLKGSYQMNRVKMYWGGTYAKAYQLQVSDDMITWKTVYATQVGAGGAEDVQFTGADGKFIRIYATGRSNKNGYALHEFEVYGTKNDETPPEPGYVAPPFPHLPIPTAKQLAYQKMETIAFVHFGMNTFTGKEWGTGKESPSQFNPTNFDAKQWMAALKNAGLKMVILTVKHHDGFVLYPSQYTEHSVKNSPWKGGKGDIVKEVSDAARETGIKFGIYLSPWDMNAPSYGKGQAYNDYYMNQLRELLTNYGEISEIWMDGAKGDNVQQDYDFDAWAKLIYELQPKALIWGPPLGDVRWNGNETGFVDDTHWAKVVPNLPQNPPWAYVPPAYDNRDYLKGHANGTIYQPAESDVKQRSGWFWSPGSSSKSLNQLVDIYQTTVGRGATLLLNVSPDTTGQIPASDVANLQAWKTQVMAMYANDLAAKGSATASETRGNASKYGAQNVLDDSYDTYWTVDDGVKAGIVEIALDKERYIDSVLLQEYVPLGQRISKFTIETWLDGKWSQIAQGATVGYKKIVSFPAVKTTKIRINITESQASPILNRVGVYLTKPVGSENLALKKPAAASNVHSNNPTYAASQAVDGSSLTRWATEDNNPQAWLEVDLGGNKTFDKVVINEFQSRISSYAIQYWNGSAWLDAYTGTTIGADKTITFTPVTGSKVRLNMKSVNVSQGPSIWEFQVYNTQPVEEEDLVSPGNTTYYVDDMSGADTNSGTGQDQAWKSLAQVNKMTYKPGDKILFRAGGKWSGSLQPKGSGAAGNPIAIGRYGEGNKPLIEGQGLVENTVMIYNQEHWEISHLEITNKGVQAATSPRRGVLVMGEDYKKGSQTNVTDVQVLHGIYIHDLYVHDVNGEDKKDMNGSAGIQVGVRIQGVVNNVPDPNRVIQRTTFDDIKIINNEVRNVARSGIVTWNDWKSRDLLGSAYGSSDRTPWTPITNVVIRGNKLYDVGGDGIVPHMTDGALVEYNFLDGYNRTSSGYNAGMWTWDGDNTLYQFNEVTRGYSTRDGQPFDFDHGTQGIIYQFNYSYNNDGGNLLICSDGSGGEVRNGIYRYNISQNDKYQIFTICGANNVKNIQVYNNVFYVKEGMNTNLLVSQGGAVDVSLYNNIFINNGTGGYTAKPSWKYNNNAFYGNRVPTVDRIPDPFMITGDPKLVDPGKAGTVLGGAGPIVPEQVKWDALNGYKLQDDSPLINAGRFIGVTHNPGPRDYFGNPIYNGMPDVGAHEYAGQTYPHVDPFEPVIPKPPAVIKNGDFENTAQHGPRDPWDYQWNNGAGIVSDGNAHGGSYAGIIKKITAETTLEQTFTVQPDTTYRISAYAKVLDPQLEIMFGVKGTGIDKSVRVTSSDYTLQTLEFTTGSSTNSAIVYFYKKSGPAANAYIDDIKIEEVVQVPIDKSKLQAEIDQAKKLYVETAVGTSPGQVSEAAKGKLGAAITAAQGVYDNSAAKQADIDAAAATLREAVQAFKNAIVPTQPDGPTTTLAGVGKVQAGSTFTVTFGLDKLRGAVYAQDFSLTYDSDVLEYVGAEPIRTGVNIVDKMTSTAGELRFIIASEGAAHAVQGKGDVLQLTFRAKPVTQPASGTVTVSHALVADDQGAETSIESASYLIKVSVVTPGIPGDTNGDGKVSIGDLAIAAANYGRTSQDPNWANIKASDFNGDGKIDIEDLAEIAKRIVL